MEMETVMSYIANSINRTACVHRKIIESLGTDVRRNSATRRFHGARQELYGVVPGSLTSGRAVLPPAARRADGHRPHHQGRHRGRTGAINHYNRIIEFARA
jgi:hypothetical protein